MRIGVIGSGNIGSVLGTAWLSAGHEVLFSYSTDEAKLRALAEAGGPLGRWGSVADAAAFGEVVALSVPWPRVGEVLEVAGDLAGRVLLDTTNAFGDVPAGFRPPSEGGSVAVQIQSRVPRARLVKVFNTLYFQTLAGQAHRAGGLLAMPLSGDDPAARAVAATLVRDAGFAPVDLGSLAGVARQEPDSPIYNQQLSALELRAALGLPFGPGS